MFGRRADHRGDAPGNGAVSLTPQLMSSLDVICMTTGRSRQQSLTSAIEAWLATAKITSLGGHIELVAADGQRDVIGPYG